MERKRQIFGAYEPKGITSHKSNSLLLSKTGSTSAFCTGRRNSFRRRFYEKQIVHDRAMAGYMDFRLRKASASQQHHRKLCVCAQSIAEPLSRNRSFSFGCIDPLDFQRMLNALASTCSKTSLPHIKVVYCEAYQEAVRNNLCTRNPIREIQIPKQASRKKVTGMSVSEQKAFEFALLQLAFMDRCMILTYLLTGMRRDELWNLCWSDWNEKQ